MAGVPAATVFAQSAFVDDAKRTVTLPPSVTRVFAAGAPAEVLLYTLVPEKLVGRNRVPEGPAVEFFPPAYRNPVFVRQLPEVDNPAADAELVALKPDVYVDYGTVHDDYIAVIEAVQKRTGVAGIILDGELARIPAVYRRLGTAFGTAARGNLSATRPTGCWPSIAARCRLERPCASIGLLGRRLPTVSGRSEWGRAARLAGRGERGRHARHRPATGLDHRRNQEPVAAGCRGQRRTGHGGAAARESCVAVRRGRRGGPRDQWPGLPYGWGARPPSVNRLPGSRGSPMWPRAAGSTTRSPSTSRRSTATSTTWS